MMLLIINGSYTGPVNPMESFRKHNLAMNGCIRQSKPNLCIGFYAVTLNLDDAPGLTGDNVYTLVQYLEIIREIIQDKAS